MAARERRAGASADAGAAADAASGHRPQPQTGSEPPQLPLRAVGIGVAVALFAVAAFAARAAGGSGLAGTGVIKHLWPLVALVLLVGLGVLVSRLRGWQAAEPAASPRTDRLLTLLVPGVLVTGLLGIVAVFVMGTASHGHDQPSAPPPPPKVIRVTAVPTPAKLAAVAHRHRHAISLPWLSTVLWVLALVVAAAVVTWVVLYVLPRLRRPASVPPVVAGTPEPPEEERALASAVRAGRAALAGDDARAAIIACYAAMEDSLAATGFGRHEADTPEDLLRRAAEAGLLSADGADSTADAAGAGASAPAVELTTLFREARYSSHPLTAPELARARDALETISADLATRAAAARAAAEAAARAAAAAAKPETPRPEAARR